MNDFNREEYILKYAGIGTNIAASVAAALPVAGAISFINYSHNKSMERASSRTTDRVNKFNSTLKDRVSKMNEKEQIAFFQKHYRERV